MTLPPPTVLALAIIMMLSFIMIIACGAAAMYHYGQSNFGTGIFMTMVMAAWAIAANICIRAYPRQK